MDLPDKLSQKFRAPKLTRMRIILALVVAVTADGLQFFLGPLGWAFIDQAIDVVALLLTAWAIGFHLLLLPTFVVEILPVADMLPTWTACVIAVIALRKREQHPMPLPSLPANFHRTPRVTKLFIATRNVHKVGEIRAILGAQFQFLTLNDFSAAPQVVEDADTFAGNAAKKAVELARWLASADSRFTIHDSPFFVLADDSGLEVDALGGAPGVHSARFAAVDSAISGNTLGRRQQCEVVAPVEGRAVGKTHRALPLRHRFRARAARENRERIAGLLRGRIGITDF